MKKQLPGLFWLLFLPLLSAAALKVPPIQGPEEHRVITRNANGEKRWQARWNVEVVHEGGQTLARFQEAGQGHYAYFRQKVRWTTEAVWSMKETFSPQRAEKKFTNLDRKLLMVERKVFDFDGGTVQFERRPRGGRPVEKELHVPADTLIPEGLGTALRALPFGSSQTLRAHLLSNEPHLYSVELRVVARETIKMPGGQVECYKVEMKPNLGLLDLLRFLLPKIYFWFSAETPHYWLRYQGLEAGRQTPQVVMELEAQPD